MVWQNGRGLTWSCDDEFREIETRHTILKTHGHHVYPKEKEAQLNKSLGEPEVNFAGGGPLSHCPRRW